MKVVLRRFAPVLIILMPGCNSRFDLHLPECNGEVMEMLQRWDAQDPLVAAPGRVGPERYRIPTSRLGEWITVELVGGSPQLFRLTRDSLERWTFDSACGAALADQRPQVTPTTPMSFTDDSLASALERAVAGGQNGVVLYVWSPHMPLSAEGYAEVVSAASAVNLVVEPVLFSDGDTAFAARQAQEMGIPPAGLRELHAVDPVMRDAHVHAPSVLVYTEHRVFPVLPGYRDAPGYERYFRELPLQEH